MTSVKHLLCKNKAISSLVSNLMSTTRFSQNISSGSHIVNSQKIGRPNNSKKLWEQKNQSAYTGLPNLLRLAIL
jgi:hypothetical protein